MKVGADGGADGGAKGGAAGWPRSRRAAAAACAAVAVVAAVVVAGLWVGGVALLVSHADVGMCVDCCGSGPAPASPSRYNVLLLGDSIAAGYAPFVAAELADVAAVQRGGGPGSNHSFNGGNSRRGVACAARWCGNGTTWDVVHFNHGLWDVVARRHARRWATVPFRRRKTWTEATHVPEAEYAANVREIASRLANRSRSVVFATTTPLAACTPRCTPKRKRSPDRVRAYNDAAVAALPPGVFVDDLHAAALSACGGGAFPDAGCAALPLLRTGDVHFAPEGSAFLARVVADAIRAALPATT